MKILILKPSSLGDVVQALPVLRMIKRSCPEALVYWWISSDLAPLLEEDPDLAGLYRFDRRDAANPISWPDLFSQIDSMRSHRFDWVIDLQSLARSSVVAWLANGATTIGLNDPREGAPTFFDLAIPRPSYGTHAVDWYLQVLPALGVRRDWAFDWLPTTSALKARARERFGNPQVRVAFVPGARWENKRWPAEYFAQLARLLVRQYPGVTITVIGGKGDRSIGETIRAAAPEAVQELTGRTTLPEMVELIRTSRAIVTNDTGPMHIAAALRIPVVPIFGPTDPRRTGPYGQIERALQEPLSCVPCMEPRCRNAAPLACLRSLTPERVFEHVQRSLQPQ